MLHQPKTIRTDNNRIRRSLKPYYVTDSGSGLARVYFWTAQPRLSTWARQNRIKVRQMKWTAVGLVRETSTSPL